MLNTVRSGWKSYGLAGASLALALLLTLLLDPLQGNRPDTVGHVWTRRGCQGEIIRVTS